MNMSYRYLVLPALIVAAPAFAGDKTAPAPAAAAPAATAPAAAAPAAAAPVAGAVDAEGKVVLAAGVAVKDPQGGAVGTITAVEPATDGSGNLATIDTGSYKPLVPVASFARTETHAVIAMTREQLNQAAAAAEASTPASGASASAAGSTSPNP